MIRLYNLKSSWEKLYNFTLKILNWSRFINDPLKLSASSLFNMINVRINEEHIGEQLYFEDGEFQNFTFLGVKICDCEG